MEKPWDLRVRTRDFAVAGIALAEKIPESTIEFVSKLQITLEEADECEYWLDLMIASGLIAEDSARSIRSESKELAAILMTSLKTSRGITQHPHQP